MAHSVCDNCHGTGREPGTRETCPLCLGNKGHDEYTIEDRARDAGIKLITGADGTVTAIDGVTGTQGKGDTVRHAIDDLLDRVPRRKDQ